MMNVPENLRPIIQAMGELFQIGQAQNVQLEDRRYSHLAL